MVPENKGSTLPGKRIPPPIALPYHEALLFIGLACLVGYVGLIFISYTINPSILSDFKKRVEAAPLLTIGIPSSALSAYIVVALFEHIFPMQKAELGQPVVIKVFGLEFSGPSGPIVLWVICFISFILATNVLKQPS